MSLFYGVDMRVIFFKKILHFLVLTVISFSLALSPFSVEAKPSKKPQSHKVKRTSKSSARQNKKPKGTRSSRAGRKDKRGVLSKQRINKRSAKRSPKAKRVSSQRRQVRPKTRNIHSAAVHAGKQKRVRRSKTVSRQKTQAPIPFAHPELITLPKVETQHLERDRLAREEEARQRDAQYQAEMQRLERARLAMEEEARQQVAQRQAENAQRLERGRLAQEEAARQQIAQREAEGQHLERDRLVREEEARHAEEWRQQVVQHQAEARRAGLAREGAARQQIAQRQAEKAKRLKKARLAREEEARQQLARRQAENEQRLEGERLAREEERQNVANALIPVVAEGSEQGLTVKKLLEELATKRVHNIPILQALPTTSKNQIIEVVNLKIQNGQIENNKAAASKALIEETVKVQCANVINLKERQLRAEGKQPDAHEILSENEKKEVVDRAAALFIDGKASNFLTAIGKIRDRLSIKKEFSTENDPIDWEEAANISYFINNAKIADKKLAKFYYDLGSDFYQTMDIGPSIRENRELILLILQNKEAHEPTKLDWRTAENYAKKHLRAILNSPSPEKYFERLERQRLKSLYHAEAAEREQNHQRVIQQRFQNANQEAGELIGHLFNIGEESQYQNTKFNLAYFYSDPNLVYFLDADKNLEYRPITKKNMEDLSNLLIEKLIVYAQQYPDKYDLDISRANIKNALQTRINACKNPMRKARMRARMVRAYKNATEGNDALHPNRDIAIARFASRVEKNDYSRCIDGIDEWLTGYEMKRIYKAPKDKGFSVLVSALLNEEKMKFIKAHVPPQTLPWALNYSFHPAELATEGVLGLLQRLRVPLGLPILPGEEMEYQHLAGNRGDTVDIYDPSNVIERFFKGGRITYIQNAYAQVYVPGFPLITEVARATVDFEPFTVKRFINLVRTAWINKTIKHEWLLDEIQKDWVLKQAYESAFRDDAEIGTGNKYFKKVDPENPEAWEDQCTVECFRRLLLRKNNLIDPTEPGFY